MRGRIKGPSCAYDMLHHGVIIRLQADTSSTKRANFERRARICSAMAVHASHRPERFEHGAQHGVGDGGAQRPHEQLAVVAELVAGPPPGAALEARGAQPGSAKVATAARRGSPGAEAGAGRPAAAAAAAAAQLLQEAVVLRVQARPRILACKCIAAVSQSIAARSCCISTYACCKKVGNQLGAWTVFQGGPCERFAWHRIAS